MNSRLSQSIIVLTIRGDAHLPYVQQHLAEPLIVVDPMVDPKSQLSYVFDDRQMRILYEGTEITTPKSIWFRKPRMTDYEKLPVAERNLAYSKSALDMHWTALYSLFPDTFWVSGYYAIQRAGRKPAQLQTAARLGFSVPRTLFTSDAKAAEQFVRREKTCIVKPLANRSALTEDGTPKPFFTRKVHANEVANFSGLHLAPSIFQQMIDVKLELRVTVVGSKTFTGAITTSGLDSDSSYLDYKIAYLKSEAQVIIEPYSLPKDIADKCIAHARTFDLSYCAIDLLLDTKGTYWFLENNPNGQWAFMESGAGLPIGKAIAELLERGKI